MPDNISFRQALNSSTQECPSYQSTITITRFVSLLPFLVLLILFLASSGCSWFGSSNASSSKNIDELISIQQARKEFLLNKQTEDQAENIDHEAQGDSLQKNGAWSAAIIQYSKALQKANPTDQPRILYKIADLSFQNKLYEQSFSIYLKISKDSPRDALAWQGMGLSQLSLNDTVAAHDLLSKAVELDNQLWKSHNGLGIILNRKRLPLEAIDHFNKAIRINSKSAVLFNNLALSYILLNDMDNAEFYLKRAIITDPNYTLAYNNLGMVLAKCGREEEAMYAFQKATNKSTAHANMGCVLASKGEYKRAYEEFQEAINVSSSYNKSAGKMLNDMEDIIELKRSDEKGGLVLGD